MHACLSSSVSLCCAHKLQGAQLVASANAMTDLAIGFIRTSTDPMQIRSVILGTQTVQRSSLRWPSSARPFYRGEPIIDYKLPNLPCIAKIIADRS
jgi:hypothetical protein